MKVAQSCLTLCDPMGYTAHGILQTRILEWVAVLFSRGCSQSRNWTQVSRIAGRFFPHCRQILYHLSLQESPNMPLYFPICGSFLLFLLPYKMPYSAFAVEVLLFLQSYIHHPVGPHLSPPEVIPNSPLSPFWIGIFRQVKHSIVIFFSPSNKHWASLVDIEMNDTVALFWISRWMIQLPCFLGGSLSSQGKDWSVTEV